jgi:prolipoprotein diacylglyceryltransferase
MLPVVDIGPLSIQTSGLLLLIGLWVGLLRTERYARRLGLDANQIYNLTMITLLAGLVGARLVYAGQHPGAFTGNLLGLLALTPEMLDPLGGIVVGLLAAFIYGQRKNIPLWNTLDAFTPAFAILMIVIGLSHLASGRAYGAPSDLPWSISLWGAERHPTQIYETLIAIAITVLIWPREKQRWAETPGVRFLIFLAANSAARLFLEAFRGDSHILFASLRTAQIVSWVLLALSIYLIRRRLTRQAYMPQTGASIDEGKNIR